VRNKCEKPYGPWISCNLAWEGDVPAPRLLSIKRGRGWGWLGKEMIREVLCFSEKKPRLFRLTQGGVKKKRRRERNDSSHSIPKEERDNSFKSVSSSKEAFKGMK